MSTLEDFIRLLSEELSIDEKEILPQSEFRELRNWSSLNALLILSRIHEVKGILLSPAQLSTAKTVKEFFELI
ncbi:MAG: acyl carrier protein [Flavobacteriia bacterium]|nr:acyl carrier protein [Flavobacteriia bacterium]OJX35351.1 MAG: hypothetical protein BGO87_12150 [Flavobacteriia bacterium 40-80]